MRALTQIAGALLGLVLFAAALIFTSLVLAVAGGIALVLWVWLWWKMRGLRREAAKAGASVIEGEYRVERETRRIDDDVH